jgi:hypothetical protein
MNIARRNGLASTIGQKISITKFGVHRSHRGRMSKKSKPKT